MDDYSLGIALGQKRRAEGAESGLRAALEACEMYKARIAALELELTIEKSHSGGIKAQMVAYETAHPSSPLRVDSGKRYKSGNIKTVGRILYEATFDKIAKAAGITSPARHRAD